MEKEILRLLREFDTERVLWNNEKRPPFEDEAEFSLAKFYDWLEFRAED